jgi:glycosyltransferase involved in cell wall biosynthesis
MKIDTCIIVKNEEKTIKKLIEQFLVFSNEIHITDTGSTDNTIKIIEDYQKSYSNVFLHHFEWCMDFAKARNYSLTCYDCKADYQFWCDGDDELNDKLLETLKEFSTSDKYDADIYFMKYQYFDGDKNPHNRTSLLKVGRGLEWHDPIHEYIGYTTSHKVDYDTFSNGSLIIHRRDPNVVHTDRNLQIFMQMERNQYPFTCRNRYYYARELMYNKLYDCAINQYHKCIDSTENNRLDKYNACNRLFEVNDPEAIDYFFKMMKNNVYRKDMFYTVGKYYYENHNEEMARLYYLWCINCPEPKNGQTFGYNKICHINSLLQLNVIEYKLGNIELAKKYNNEVLKLEPSNATALNNLVFYKKL